MRTNCISEVSFANISFDGTTVNEYNGKKFVASNYRSGYGSGRKTVGDFEIEGTRFNNIAVDRLKSILGGSTSSRQRTPLTVAGLVTKIIGLFDDEPKRKAKITKVCKQLLDLEAAFKAEDEKAANEAQTVDFLRGLNEEEMAALIARVQAAKIATK